LISVNRTGTQSVKFNQSRQCHSSCVPFLLPINSRASGKANS